MEGGTRLWDEMYTVTSQERCHLLGNESSQTQNRSRWQWQQTLLTCFDINFGGNDLERNERARAWFSTNTDTNIIIGVSGWVSFVTALSTARLWKAIEMHGTISQMIRHFLFYSWNFFFLFPLCVDKGIIIWCNKVAANHQSEALEHWALNTENVVHSHHHLCHKQASHFSARSQMCIHCVDRKRI